MVLNYSYPSIEMQTVPELIRIQSSCLDSIAACYEKYPQERLDQAVEDWVFYLLGKGAMKTIKEERLPFILEFALKSCSHSTIEKFYSEFYKIKKYEIKDFDDQGFHSRVPALKVFPPKEVIGYYIFWNKEELMVQYLSSLTSEELKKLLELDLIFEHKECLRIIFRRFNSPNTYLTLLEDKQIYPNSKLKDNNIWFRCAVMLGLEERVKVLLHRRSVKIQDVLFICGLDLRYLDYIYKWFPKFFNEKNMDELVQAGYDISFVHKDPVKKTTKAKSKEEEKCQS